MSAQSIQLQLGPYSNHVGSHFWNIAHEQRSSELTSFEPSTIFAGKKRLTPRCVVVDYSSNLAQRYSNSGGSERSEILWSGPTQVIQRNVSAFSRQAEPTKSQIDRHERWVDNLLVPFSDRSIMQLPASLFPNNFDSFFSGYHNAPNLSVNHVVDETLERLRVFAEECDYLSSINILADVDDGFGGLTCALLPSIREEFGNSVVMPVWAFSNGELYNPATIAGRLHNVQLPIIYTKITEHASFMCPLSSSSALKSSPFDIEKKPLSPIQKAIFSSSVFALGIETITSSLRWTPHSAAAASYSHRLWADSITSRSQYPLLSVEISYPNIIDLSDANNYMWPYLSEKQSSLALSQDEHRRVLLNTKTLNHFLTPLSLFRSNIDTSSITVPYSQRSPSNNIFVRGPSREDLSNKLFLKCINTDYAVTNVNQSQIPVILPPSYPYIGESGELEYQPERSLISHDSPVIAAVGVDVSIEHHITRVLKDWTSVVSAQSSSLTVQLDNAGISKEDRLDIREAMTHLLHRYEADR